MDGQSNGLGKLLPKSIANRRRSRASDTQSLNDDGPQQPQSQSQSQRDRDVHSLPGSLKSSTADPADEAASRPESSHSSHSSSRPTDVPPVLISSVDSTSSTSSRNTKHPLEAPAPPSTVARHADNVDPGPALDRSRTSLGHSGLGKKRSSSSSRLRDVFKPKKGEKPDDKRSDAPAAPIGDHLPPTARARDPPPRLPLELRPAPRTPPAPGEAQPVIVNTPPTPTESVPDPLVDGLRRPADAVLSGKMMTQRRRSGSSAGPSKLSAVAPALSPTPESPPASPNPAATFFSSMFSAVQNTANSLSTSIPTLAQTQAKSKGIQANNNGANSTPDTVEVESSAPPRPSTEPKEPAVKTLGAGDLSLSQLGIVDPPSVAPSPVVSRFAESEPRSRSESAPVDPRAAVEAHDEAARPRSLYEAAGDQASHATEDKEKSGLGRTGSIRSAVHRRRHRGSSITTHTTAATSTAGVSTANQAPAPGPKLTGFAVANKKRNRDFHNLFKSVPDDDYLIEDYSCALQREILAHGRLYISEGHLCFSSNILGWVTTLVLSFDEIVSVEKRSTALVFKNGLEISTLHAKHIFASFASRDTTYDLIIKIWKLGHPHLQSSLNGVRLEEPGGDRTEKIDVETASATGSTQTVSGSEESDEGEEDDDVYDEDEDDAAAPPAAASDVQASDFAEKAAPRKVSGPVLASEKKEDGAPAAVGDFPGPATHAPTDCGDAATHFEKVLADDVIPAPLGKVYDMLFGPSSAAWMGKWLTTDQKCWDLQMDDKRGLTDEVRSRNYTYVKPLSASIGPKQTKCIVTEQLEQLDLEKAVSIVVSTQNPDVPSGNIFIVKTKYCLTWAENNGTRIQVNNVIEWSGKSWIKSAIERGVSDGQGQYCKELFAALKAAVSSRARAGTGGAAGRKKRARKQPSALASGAASDAEGAAAVSARQHWGLLEPVRPFLGPVVGTIRPLLTGNVVYGLLVGLLVASWFGFGTRPPYHGAGPAAPAYYADAPARLAAYDELWRAEESELWEWLEERAGLDRIAGVGGPGGAEHSPLHSHQRRKSVDPRTLEEKLREARMDERELREAIRVTEEHLEVLKAVVDRRSAEGAAGR
ncbi:hypothetical protein VTJ49DRAFT_6233 [Mycothermus thermophilus]|uniref:VASt domain-containing protein n=1 Tax=Humicola insolens TaxID=85995 RepID=A0ABR3VKT8_HUMIN